MDLSKMPELKKKLVHAKVLAEIWTFFCDHFADHPEFIDLGERVENDFLQQVVSKIAEQVAKGPVEVSPLLLTQLPDQHLIHGGFAIPGRLGGLLYFEDIQTGLVVLTGFPPSTEVNCARFSGRQIKRIGEPSLN